MLSSEMPLPWCLKNRCMLCCGLKSRKVTTRNSAPWSSIHAITFRYLTPLRPAKYVAQVFPFTSRTLVPCIAFGKSMEGNSGWRPMNIVSEAATGHRLRYSLIAATYSCTTVTSWSSCSADADETVSFPTDTDSRTSVLPHEQRSRKKSV